MILALMAILACSENSVTGADGITTDDIHADAARLASVTVSLASSSIAAGDTTRASATLRDNRNRLIDQPVVWSSSNTAVAKVDTTGLVTGIAAGTASITATRSYKSGSATVTVTGSISATTPPPPAPAPSGTRWVSGYWVGYQRSQYPENQIDMSLLTHIVVGAINPTSSGGVTTDFFIDATTGPQVARTISARAHSAGRKAILMLGGSGQLTNFRSASSATNIDKFVANLVSTMDNLGYDGIDVDWEPVNSSDKPTVISLLQKLRAARPSMIITFPIGWVGYNQGADPWYAQVASIVNQVNIMSYGMADSWPGWVSWHSAALSGEGSDHPSSITSNVTQYIKAGVPAAKLGIGLGFYGSCWRGPTAPLQSTGSGVVASDNTMSYSAIMSSYYNAAAYHWDATAHMGYLSFAAQTGPQGCTFVSYEDARSIADKGAYMKSVGAGGTIIWTINQGHISSAAAGAQDPLLQAAYQAFVM